MLENIAELAKTCPRLQISVELGSLVEAIDYCISKTRKDLEQQITDANAETYPTPEKVSEMLGIDRSTLWRWNKTGYLKCISIGGKRRYRMSDIKKLIDDENK
ncbi:MAG: helix-turn-helix domain-containing protein [Prevotella sp.]|jgi:predicted DNA-binding transcriptional regulator AlpA|nr:helix-turn-helix domain-containing protein [Prevotella sp.]